MKHHFERFVRDRLIFEHQHQVRACELYEAYKLWCEEHEETPVSQKLFGKMLRERDVEPKKKNTGVYYLGVGLA